MSHDVRIVEVGPRDGLQNEAQPVSTAIKLELISRLADAGLKCIEATAFVSKKWVPQMADHDELTRALVRRPGTSYPVWCPSCAASRRRWPQAPITWPCSPPPRRRSRRRTSTARSTHR